MEVRDDGERISMSQMDFLNHMEEFRSLERVEEIAVLIKKNIMARMNIEVTDYNDNVAYMETVEEFIVRLAEAKRARGKNSYLNAIRREKYANRT